MTITVNKHGEEWEADIEASDYFQLFFNGAPLAETLVTVPAGNSARIYLRYTIKKDGT